MTSEIESLMNLSPVPAVRLPEPAERTRLRTAFGITQARLATSLGISRKTIIRWEAGTAEPTGNKRIEYAAILSAWAETEKNQ
jgi:DNA-binding XRE family transcriptional regulator